MILSRSVMIEKSPWHNREVQEKTSEITNLIEPIMYINHHSIINSSGSILYMYHFKSNDKLVSVFEIGLYFHLCYID